MRATSEVVREAERLAESSWSLETETRLETLLWVLGEVDDDHLSGAVDSDRLRDLTGSRYYGDDADLSRLVGSESDGEADR